MIDGDTLEVDTSHGPVLIRMAAINAPERDECHSEAALGHLAEDDGSKVKLEIVGSDQYGRALAHVFVGDRHLNLEMVSLGLAIASTPERGDVHGDDVLAAEETAYENSVGLWGAEACGASGSPANVVIAPERSSPDAPGPDDENLRSEIIALVNEGAVDVDLSGWIIRDESSRHRYTFQPGVTLGAGEELSITSADPGWSPGGGAVWNNDGDMALLQDSLGTVVDRWRY